TRSRRSSARPTPPGPGTASAPSAAATPRGPPRWSRRGRPPPGPPPATAAVAASAARAARPDSDAGPEGFPEVLAIAEAPRSGDTFNGRALDVAQERCTAIRLRTDAVGASPARH